MPNCERPESEVSKEREENIWEGTYNGFKVRLTDPQPDGGSCPTEMSGTLNGHEIEVSWQGYSYRLGVGGLEMTVDGKKMLKEDAAAIWVKQKSKLLGAQLEAQNEWRAKDKKEMLDGLAGRRREIEEKWKADGVSDIVKDLTQ